MSQLPSLPIVFNTDALVAIEELRNGLPLQDYNLSDTQFESFICTNLANEVLPYGLSDTFPYGSTPSSTSLSFRADQDPSGTQLLGKTIILNNESLINSETFAMKMNYISTGGGGTPDLNYASISTIINTTIALDASTNSVYDSNLKITIDPNNEDQLTDALVGVSDQTVWKVNFSRNSNAMNYFAAINSVYEQDEDPSPFYILEESNNSMALGSDPTQWFSEDLSGLSGVSGKLVNHDIDTSNLLDTNHLQFTVTDNGYSFSDFNSYKLSQDTPYTLADLSGADGSVLPIQYVTESPVDLSSTTFNFSGVFQDTDNVGSGFTIQLDISANPTPYSVASNELFTLDNSTLVSDAAESYIQLTNIQDLSHTLIEITGTLTANSTETDNSFNILISDDYETLDEDFYATNGKIELKVDTMGDRVYYSSGSNADGSHGTASLLTDHVNVVYCGEENGTETTCINDFSNGILLTTDSVSFYLEVKSTSTVYSDPEDFFTEDPRNLAYDNSAILVIADPNINISANSDDFSLNSYIPYDAAKVYIISVQNESILAEESPLLDPDANEVSGTTASVTMSGVDISGLPYTDFRVRLDTKTVLDISNQLQLTNNWSPKNPEDYMIGTALKTSVIYDDYLFMTTDPSMNIAMTYEFQVANPVCASTQAIKHAVKISFNDLSENLQYNTTPTVFYLDDQDITINQISSVDTSGDICTSITSNNGGYPVNDYVFEKYTRRRTYTAEFDSKFQFYQNLIFVTPTISEDATFYKIFKNGVEQPSYLLRYFSCVTSGHLLSNVYVSLVGQPITTSFAYTQTVCSIFNATILGTTNGIDYDELPDVEPVPLDPFFRQNCVLLNITSGGHGHADIGIKFDSGVNVDKSFYYVDMQNALGANLSLTSKRYIYDTTTNGSELDNYTPYNNFYDTLMSDEPLLYTNVERVGDVLTVTIKTSVSGTTLAVISQPYNYLNDYNIILSPAPVMQVDYTIGSNPLVSERRLVFNNTLKVIDGIYYYMNSNNVVIGASESFNLVTDSFKLWFVDAFAFPNNKSEYTTNYVKFTEANIQTWLNCSSSAYNQTRSIWFNQLRGYARATSGVDNVTLLRTSMSARFELRFSDTEIASQTFNDIYYDKEVTVDAVAYDGSIYYDLGLTLRFKKSMLNNNRIDAEFAYPISVSLPSYAVNVIANPFNTDLIGLIDSGYLTSNSNLFAPYFNNVRPASIQSMNDYRVTVTYTVPDLQVYSATTQRYIGNPADVSLWSPLSTITHNDLLGYTNIIPSFKIRRESGSNVFYDNYVAFFVIAPPVVSVYSNTTNTTTVPIPYNPSYIGSFHINSDVNNYVNNTQYSELIFSEYTTKSYNSYLDVNTSPKRFRIEGNKLTVEFYAGGVGPIGTVTGPAAVDAAGTVIATLIDGIELTQLENGGLYNNVRVQYNGYSYDFYYKQYLLFAGANNSSENVKFNIGNAFINLPLVSYLRLPSGQGTSVDLYQTNVAYDISGADSSYYMIIDKFTSDITVNYNSVLDTTIRELFFPISHHYVKQIPISEDIIDGSGSLINYSELVDLITYTDIYNASWVVDLSFDSIQYSGLTLSAITEQGRLNMQNVFKYNPADSLQSKSLYIKRPDIIRANNLSGNTVYRVTNGGNVHAPRVTTSNLSLFVAPTLTPINSSIPGFNDIQSLFAQNSLMNSGATLRP